MALSILKTYKVMSNGMGFPVKIVDTNQKIREYHLIFKKFEKPTLAVLESLRDEISQSLPVDLSGSSEIILKRQESLSRIRKILRERLPAFKPETENQIIAFLFNEMFGLGYVEVLLSDEFIEEIVINAPKEPIYIYHREFGWLKTNILLGDEEKVRNYATIIARKVGRQITDLSPILDAHLMSGDRSNAVLFPVSQKGHTITIRRFARDTWTVTDFIRNKTCSSEVFALIWLAFQYEMNILFSGGTASGKTSFLNVCMPFLPANQRIVTIEDTRELNLPVHLFWTPLVTKQPNAEGRGEVTMLDLMINSLRMRPDRIILGEVRRAEEAHVAFEAMHTGHAVYTTVHANDMRSTIARLVNPPISIPRSLLEIIDMNVVLLRNRKTGIRRVLEVGEFMASASSERTEITPNILYSWNPKVDRLVEHSPSMTLFKSITRHTGLSLKDIHQSLEQRNNILRYFVKHDLRDINVISSIINKFYVDTDFVLRKVKEDCAPGEFFS